MFTRSLCIRCLAASLLLQCSLFGAPKIGVLLKSKDGGFWVGVTKGATEAGQKLGADVSVTGPLHETDISVQIRLLNAMAARGVDAIVIAPINSSALAGPIASMAVRGVKIVVIDTPLKAQSAPVFVGTDQDAAGRAAGELVAHLTTPSDEVSVFRHSQASGATMTRETAAIATLHSLHPTAAVHGEVFASAEPGEEVAKAEFVLAQHPNIKAVLATGTDGTMAMLHVLQQKHLTGTIKLVGFGFNLNREVAAALESGDMAGWIAQLPEDVGAKGVAAALDLINGKAVPPVVHTKFVVVTKDNLHDPAVQALLSI